MEKHKASQVHENAPTVSPAPLTLPSKEVFRNAMARLGAAVSIVTTDGPAGRAGFTASAVCSVTDDPPTLLVCINRKSSAYHAVKINEAVCINVLAGGHQEISNRFGGKTPMDERFAGTVWNVGVTGAPTLDDAAAAFDCQISGSATVGTHDVLYCQVVHVRINDACHALVYCDRHYHELAFESDAPN